jgi:two-component system response regulator
LKPGKRLELSLKQNHQRGGVVQILLVEDNRDDEELTLLALAENHLATDIKVVRDGAEALDFLFATGQYADQKTDLPRLILLDVKLPKVSGIEVLQRVKQDKRTSKIPVVMLTSSREDPDVKRSYELGANSYIVKPVDFNQFKEAIKLLGVYWQTRNVPPPG